MIPKNTFKSGLVKGYTSLSSPHKHNLATGCRSRYENSLCPCRILKSLHHQWLLQPLQGKVWNTKKFPSLLKGTTREKVVFISVDAFRYSLKNIFEVLEISKSSYYKFRNAEDKDYYDYLLTKEIFEESKRTYGYRSVCEGLKIKYGVILNHKKVLRIMLKYNLKPEHIKKIRPNIAYRRIESNVKPNLVKRQFNVDSPNKIWTTDITYLIFNSKRLYLSTILDLYDRKVVTYKISKFNNIPLYTKWSDSDKKRCVWHNST